MTAAERQSMIMTKLRTRRQCTTRELADECKCNERTIRRDIMALTTSGKPIETVRGRYTGGVKLPDWYMPYRSTLCPEQMKLLNRIAPTLNADDLMVLNSMIDQFGPRF